jgi:GNAT superfamily N-acetyltransferase
MAITVREYVEADHDACCKLWGELAQHHADIYEDLSIASNAPVEYFDEYIDRKDRCGTWVAEYDGRVAGFAGLLDIIGEEGVAEIEPVVVTTDVRGSGIGTMLIKHAREEAKKRNFRFLTIRPVLRNEDAFSLYVKLGFDIVGSIELCQDLEERSERKWKKGIKVHGVELSY